MGIDTSAKRSMPADLIEELIVYLKQKLETNPVIDKLDHAINEGLSTAGRRPEEVFNREFLSPTLASFFYDIIGPRYKLTDEQVRMVLGTEGYKNCPQFGFSPSLPFDFFFTKDQILDINPPKGWVDNEKLRNYRSYPDFAVRQPLPVSFVGELKYVDDCNRDQAVKLLYDATRQAVFYLGAFHGDYDSALFVIADATPEHRVNEALRHIRSGLLDRYGRITKVYCCVLSLFGTSETS